MLTHIDIFTGIGGWCLAAKKCGIQTIAGCDLVYSEHRELSPIYLSKLFRQNFPEAKFYNGVEQMQNINTYADFLTMSPPCQDISVANKCKIKHINNGNRTILWKKAFQIAKKIRPKYIILENVTGFNKIHLSEYLQALHENSYNAWWKVISAKDVGLPHLRRRLYVVAIANSECCTLDKFKIFNQSIEKKSENKKNENSKIFQSINRRISAIRPYCNTDVIRVNDGLPYKLDRIKGIGNSIVPTIGEILFQTIIETFE